MADHAVVRTDLMFGTDVKSGLRSCRYMGAGDTPTEIDNGNVVKLVEIIKDANGNVNDREVWKAVTPAAGDDIGDIVLVATPELHYDERKKLLKEFYNEAGRICRGYVLHRDDIFSVTAEALDGVDENTAVGAAVELQAGTKLKVAASATNGSTQVGKLIQIEVINGVTFYVIEVV